MSINQKPTANSYFAATSAFRGGTDSPRAFLERCLEAISTQDSDIGAFVAGLEYVTGHTARIMGKPSLDFFRLGLDSLGLPPASVAMVGDDIDSDVGGGQAAGMGGILVKTGKFRKSYAESSNIQPDAIIDSIADLPALLKAR